MAVIRPPEVEVGSIGAFHRCFKHLGVCVPIGMERDVVVLRVNRAEVWKSDHGQWFFAPKEVSLDGLSYPQPCDEHGGRTHFMLVNQLGLHQAELEEEPD